MFAHCYVTAVFGPRLRHDVILHFRLPTEEVLVHGGNPDVGHYVVQQPHEPETGVHAGAHGAT